MSGKRTLKLEYEVIVKDKNGKILERQKGLSKSLLEHFMVILRVLLAGRYGTGVTASIHDLGGAVVTAYGSTDAPCMGSCTGGIGMMCAGAIDDDDTYGIMVGSGTTAVTPTDYALATKIAHGTGSGQLDYGGHTFEAVEIVSMTSRFRFSRAFSNLSGASVTVREIGVAIHQQYLRGGSTVVNIKVLVCRDVLPSPSTIPDGATLTVRYRFSVTA